MIGARIQKRFEKLKAENRAGFIAYMMTSDPDFERSQAILNGLPGAGADLIEVGVAFSDPMAEGPPIQKASLRALKSGATVLKSLELVAAFRQTDAETPIILMGYLNPVVSFGEAKFAAAAAAAGADGLIIVDCPPEEADSLTNALEAEGLALIRLATPTTDDARLPKVVARTQGFVYYVSVAGVTGVKSAEAKNIAPAVERIRAAAHLPVAVGFGVRTPERAAAVARIADAVVVGSALVDEIEAGLSAAETHDREVVAKVLEKARVLSQAVRTARKSATEA